MKADKNLKLIFKALRFAEQKHTGQFRKISGEEYISHPVMVSYIASNFKKSKNLGTLVCAAILHDVIEDTQTSYEELLSTFGIEIASLVFELTNIKEGIENKTEYLQKKMLGMSSYALFLKLCDRLANIMDQPTEKTIKETKDVLVFLQENRKLSTSQKAVVFEIEKVLSGK